MDRELQLEILKALSDVLSESFITEKIDECDFMDWAWDMNSEIKLKIGESERYFYICYGATKGVFVPMEPEFFPYVIKIPFLEVGDFDYCKKETIIYQEAQKCEDLLKDFFAPSGVVGRIGSLPVYWMEYFSITEECNDDSAIKIFIESYGRNREEDDNDEIIEEFYSSVASDSQGVFEFLLNQNYSEESVEIIEDFLCKYDINDLHTNNFYYDEDSCGIVLVDYSGY